MAASAGVDTDQGGCCRPSAAISFSSLTPRSLGGVVERDGDEQIEEIREPARVAAAALLDAPEAVLRGVRVHLQTLGRDP